MTDLRKAAEMALDTLTKSQPLIHSVQNIQTLMETIRILRQALAQPEEISDYHEGWEEGFKAGLAKAQPEQEPALKVHRGEICYKSQDDDQSFGMWCPVDYNIEHGYPNETKFYTSPPSKPWVSLTDEEFDKCDAHETWRSMRNVAEMLKEKNNG